MRDGIDQVTVNLEGAPIVVRGEVRNGVFRGLGHFSHLAAIIAVDDRARCEIAPLKAPV